MPRAKATRAAQRHYTVKGSQVVELQDRPKTARELPIFWSRIPNLAIVKYLFISTSTSIYI